jgi:hypothetical protein
VTNAQITSGLLSPERFSELLEFVLRQPLDCRGGHDFPLGAGNASLAGVTSMIRKACCGVSKRTSKAGKGAGRKSRSTSVTMV